MDYSTNIPRTVTPVSRAVTTARATANGKTGRRVEYPWLDDEYGRYFNKVQQDFADRGLLDSTNKMQPMSELASAYAAARAREKRADDAQRLAREQYNTSKDLAYRQDTRTESQRGVDNAMKLWELLTGENLANSANRLTAGMDYDYKGVAQPSIFADIFKQAYLPPGKSSGGPIGDAPVQERRPTITRPLGVDTARGDVIPTYTESAPNYAYRDNQSNIAAQMELQRQQEARLAQAASEQSRIQNAYLKLAQAQDARDAATAGEVDDPWSMMASDVELNRRAGMSEDDTSEMHPTDLFQAFMARYKVDLESVLRNPTDPNHERAISLVRSAYSDPKVAQAVIDRVMSGGSWKKPATKASPNAMQSGGAPATPGTGPRYSIAADIPEWKSQYTTPYSDGVFSTVNDIEDVTDRLMPTTALYRLADWLFNPSKPKF